MKQHLLLLISIFFLLADSYSQVANTPSDLLICDDNFDGFIAFNLTFLNSQILGSQNSVDYTLTYHVTQTDANNNSNQIANPTNYFSNTATIYARVTENSSGNYDTTSFDLIVQDCRDEDSDGVINSDEDINGNGNLDDDDTDQDSTPNYLDDDDDGDKIDTADELVDQSTVTSKSINLKGSNSLIDTDDDKIENYLDDDDDGDGVLTKDEDYNNNGTPLDDDTNSNSVPDYLEKSVALSVADISNIGFSLYPNPTNNDIYISSKIGVKIEKINIYSVSGKLLFEDNNQDIKEINLRTFPKGMYFLNIVSNSGLFIKKVIKK